MPQSTEIIYTEVAAVDHGVSGLSWSAIIGGAFVALALSFILVMLGVGFGLTSFSFWPGRTSSATTYGIGAALWVIVVQWLSAALGGYVAGRTRARWNGLHSHESTFRDTVHGILAWRYSRSPVLFWLSAPRACWHRVACRLLRPARKLRGPHWLRPRTGRGRATFRPGLRSDPAIHRQIVPA